MSCFNWKFVVYVNMLGWKTVTNISTLFLNVLMGFQVGVNPHRKSEYYASGQGRVGKWQTWRDGKFVSWKINEARLFLAGKVSYTGRMTERHNDLRVSNFFHLDKNKPSRFLLNFIGKCWVQFKPTEIVSQYPLNSQKPTTIHTSWIVL